MPDRARCRVGGKPRPVAARVQSCHEMDGEESAKLRTEVTNYSFSQERLEVCRWELKANDEPGIPITAEVPVYPPWATVLVPVSRLRGLIVCAWQRPPGSGLPLSAHQRPVTAKRKETEKIIKSPSFPGRDPC